MEVEVALDRKRVAGGYADATTTDRALAHNIAAGDTDAWNRFFDRYSSWTYRFAYRHLNGNSADAEDLCSDILLTAAKSVKSFDPGRGDLDAWMCGLARHRLARFCRGRRIELPLIRDLVDQSSDSETTASSLADMVCTKDVVNRALACLPERQAAALIGKYVEGYTTDELARQTLSSPKAIESLLVRARSAFRSAFTRLLDDSPGGGNRE